MDDPYPRVVLIPGVGMVTTGKNKDTAIASSWLYHRAITVMKGVSAVGRFVSLDEAESFGIEYWPLERYKLTQMPPEKEMTGRVALVTGGASGIGRAAAEGLARLGAHVVLADINEDGARQAAKDIGNHAMGVRMDVTDEASVIDAFRQAVLAFGGVDVVVCCAGIAAAARRGDHPRRPGSGSTRSCHRLLPGRARGFRAACSARAAAAPSCSSAARTPWWPAGRRRLLHAKAAELHLARCLAVEGAEHGIRVNVVNPDAVIRGPRIWGGAWREERAAEQRHRPRTRSRSSTASAAC